MLLLFSQNKCLCLAWILADHYCIAQKLDQNYDTIRPKMLKDPQWQTQTKGKFKRFVHLQKRRVPLWHHKSIFRGFMRGVKGPACALSIDLLLHLRLNYCWRHYFPIYANFPKFTLTSNAHFKKWPGHHSMINHYHFKMVRAFSTSPPTVELSRGEYFILFYSNFTAPSLISVVQSKVSPTAVTDCHPSPGGRNRTHQLPNDVPVFWTKKPMPRPIT